MLGPVGDGCCKTGHREERDGVREVHSCGDKTEYKWKIVLGLSLMLTGDKLSDLAMCRKTYS